MMLCCVEEAKFGYKRGSSSRKFIRSHEGGVTKPFENCIMCYNERVDATKTLRPTKPSIYFLISYCLWIHGSDNYVHVTNGKRVAPTDSYIKSSWWGRSEAYPRGRWQKFWTISWRRHFKCVLQVRYHQVRGPYIWPKWDVHNKQEVNRRPSLII